MDRSLVMAVFTAADARFDPCGAVAFAHRLGGEIDAGRIVFPRPLVVGGGCPHGCLVLDRFPADLTGLSQAARTLARGLVDIAGAGFTIHVCGAPGVAAVAIVTRAVNCELKAHRGSAGPVGWITRQGRAVLFAVL
ncbi:hypothetical protein ACIOD2_08200 [Amycolatopsis sp. NPDC088138]|uniref:hypothetical protein n=1 Tax=Amycolatopsis sp. NPDC088138 TaxID=3363938 RepID=UPI0038236074